MTPEPDKGTAFVVPPSGGDDRLKPELQTLLDAACSGALSDEQFDRLEAALQASEEARRLYLRYCTLEGDLHYLVRMGHADSGFRVQGSESPDPKPQIPNQQISDPEPLIPPIIIDISPLPPPPLLSTLFAPGGWAFSYGVSAAIVGIAILIGLVWRVSHDYSPVIAKNSREPTVPGEILPGTGSPRLEEPQSVGRITGTADCRWADSQAAPTGRDVALGRAYALASGLVEITYATGARVILEGPCTYEVDSTRGGFLSLGKLTARVEKSQISNPKSEISNPQSPVSNSLFSVRTPTATITDLGTEFGVEVGKEGNTTSHVFRGSVRVQVVADAGEQQRGGQRDVVLRENESARVEKGEGAGDPRLMPPGAAGNPPRFARRLVEPPKLLDLLDVVAAGNGTGHRREHGVHPANGVYEHAFVGGPNSIGDHQYHFVSWHELIDGVFIPDGSAGPVQLDSARHAFDGFPKTSNTTYGPIWSRAADIAPENSAKENERWMYALGRGEQFMPDGRGLLCMNPNTAITFNLATMRKMYRGMRRRGSGPSRAWATELSCRRGRKAWPAIGSSWTAG